METDLVKFKEQYPALAEDADEIRALVADNLGDFAQLSPFDLPSISMPAAGGTSWTIPTLTGEESRDTLDGIIVAWTPSRAYWEGDFAGSEPPQCSSRDAVTGEGDPGGLCVDCPWAEWKSDSKGRGQACKQMTRLLLLQPQSTLPLLLTLAPTSIKNWRQYGTKLLDARVPYWSAVTSIGLVGDANPEGIKYSKATFKALEILDGEVAAKAKAYSQMFIPVLKSQAVD